MRQHRVPPTILSGLVAVLLPACGDSSRETESLPPTAVIDTPVAAATYAAGDTVAFSGHATDPDDGALTDDRLTWWVDFHHDAHTHPFLPGQDGPSGSVVIPTTGETSDNVWYRIYLRAVDGAGNADTTYVEVRPRKARLLLLTDAPGRILVLDGTPRPAGSSVTSVVGMEREIGVINPQTTSDSIYHFDRWSDGGAATHVIRVPEADTTLTASFVAAQYGNRRPTVAITSPAAGDTVRPLAFTPITASATDSDGSIRAVTFLVGNVVYSTDSTAPFTFEWWPLGPGETVIRARAVDNEGAVTTSADVPVVISIGSGGDTEPPTGDILSPRDGTHDLTGSVRVDVSAFDNVGVTRLEFMLDGESLGERPGPSGFVEIFTTFAYTSGVHEFRARAWDAAGNASEWFVSRVTFGASEPQADDVTRTVHLRGLNGPATAMAFAPDGRLFLAERGGAVRVGHGGALNPAPFLTLAVDPSGERGLLGLAIDPQYASNHYVYLYHTVPGSPAHNRVTRVTGNGDAVVAGSDTVIVDLPPLASTVRNGGALRFAPDGTLLIAAGDDGNGNNAQSETSRLGKVLRVNPDGSIPADNPFVGSLTGANRMIWAKGLRSATGLAVHPGTGRVLINDAGESTWEEINEGIAGANYGWPGSEGKTTNASYTSPRFTYKHTIGADNPSLLTGTSIAGGVFYAGASLFPASYAGNYFFLDAGSRWITRMDPANDNAVYQFARVNTAVSDITIGPDGAVYVLADVDGSWGVFRYGQ